MKDLLAGFAVIGALAIVSAVGFGFIWLISTVAVVGYIALGAFALAFIWAIGVIVNDVWRTGY